MDYKLNEIKNILLDITGAITNILNVDVTIADRNLNRITATGKYISTFNKKLSSNCVFSKTLVTGQCYIIDNPSIDKKCLECDSKAKCEGLAQISAPILINGVAIGVVGIIAFDDFQKKMILENHINFLGFLENMTDLIASKLIETEASKNTKKLVNELNTLLNTIDVGIIFIDKDGYIKRCNDEAIDKFSILNKEGVAIFDILPDLELIPDKPLKNVSFHYRKMSKEFHGFYNITPIFLAEKLSGYIISINSLEELIDIFGELSSTSSNFTFDNIIGNSIQIKNIIDSCKQFSLSNSSIFIQGESGTGKELFARAIHNNSTRAQHPFIALNCSAVPENLIESELFGYEEGAFTGAKKGGKLGKFELVRNGTIFLDEIGDMSLHMQAKLLRVIQEKTFMRIGGSQQIKMNARIISATNKDVEKQIEENEFRQDLFFRLNVIPILLPPLRNRRDDILLLANNFLKKYSMELKKNVNKIDDQLSDFLENYYWPGNIRELENTVEYIVNICKTQCASLNDLPKRIFASDSSLKKSDSTDNNVNFKTLEQLQKEEIQKTLSYFGRNNSGIEKAAHILGIGRATLYRKIKKYNL